MSTPDPFLLDIISGKKAPVPEEDPIDKEYKKKIGEAERKRAVEEKEQAEEKIARDLYDKVMQYHEKFPFIAEGGPKKNVIGKMCLEELEREMLRIKRILNSKASLAAVKRIDYGINFGIEYCLLMNQIPATGLAKFTASPEGQEMLAQEYQEFAIEYQDWLATSKEARYFWTTVSKVLMIIEFNKKNLGAVVPDDLAREGEDLSSGSAE